MVSCDRAQISLIIFKKGLSDRGGYIRRDERSMRLTSVRWCLTRASEGDSDRDLFGRQDLFYPVNKDNLIIGEDGLKRDRFYVDSRCPDKNSFTTVQLGIIHGRLSSCVLLTVGS
jgi:hypothetical protein